MTGSVTTIFTTPYVCGLDCTLSLQEALARQVFERQIQWNLNVHKVESEGKQRGKKDGTREDTGKNTHWITFEGSVWKSLISICLKETSN